MTIRQTFGLAILFVFAISIRNLWAAAPSETGSRLAVGARMHTEHSVFADLPFGNGDASYALAYEYHEPNAYWQFGLDYAPRVTGTNTIQSVLTPEVSLIMKERYYRGGISLLKSLKYSDEGDEWTNVYWQFLLGAGFPFFFGHLDLQAYYVFERWDQIADFAVHDIEFGGWFSFSF